MRVAIPKERWPGELRVAASPETVKKLVGLGLDVTVEKGAGTGAAVPDASFKEAGATIASDAKSTLADADIVFKVRPPQDAAEVGLMKSGALLIGLMAPHQSQEQIASCASQGVTTFAMELLPRITRAQTMDVLSSQSNLAGYRAVIDAAAEFGRAFPMMMTAAGTVAPARVFIMGAGVAGLQAIATARRLGGVVSATDVRQAAGEQVESLGAKFIMVEIADLETEAGYAREMTEEEKQKQAELVASHIEGQDVVITTALIPGRPAPRLVTKQMVQSMRPGSVLVDLAVEAGGNVEGSKADKVVTVGGVKILSYANMPSRVAVDASQLYARNLLNFLTPLIDPDSKTLKIDWEDEIVAATLLTRDGQVVHPDLAKTPTEPASESQADEAPAASGGEAEAAPDEPDAPEPGEKEED
ncbi:MAG: Re/Si-specific NAD(P)(+) transhydrogenase subunit alpha [Alphaproteobacteria bacterium]|nr:Re/Si-specific NAD(P)(+) transhydrogenase subunit alpha [Alphaproteobacteria bacterium]